MAYAPRGPALTNSLAESAAAWHNALDAAVGAVVVLVMHLLPRKKQAAAAH